MPNTVLGKVTCVPRGDYSASATYTVLDIAGYQGGSYMALKTVTGVTPSNDGINWMQLSGPGLPGEQGPQGIPGVAAGFGTPTATVDGSTGTPAVEVEASGPDTAKIFAFSFSGLKGEAGEKGDTGDTGPQGIPGVAAGFGEATATVDSNVGTPGVTVDTSGPDTAKVFSFEFTNLKGEKGDQGGQGIPGVAAGFGEATATVDNSVGTPGVTVQTSGPDTAKVFAFAFTNLKGEKGDTGDTGPQGIQGIQGEPGTDVDSIARTSGTGAPGTTDTYTMYDSAGGTIGTFTVYNGANGTGSGDFMADGSVPMTGALQMGGNRITNVGAPTAATDAVRQSDLQAVSDEVDHILDGTTPAFIPVATETKVGGIKPGTNVNVGTDGTLTIETDAAPTSGSNKPLQSGGAYTALADKLDAPDGGTTGQILTVGASGAAEWADPPDTGVTTFNNRSGAVTPQAGDYSADMIEFADGETFQQKYDAGELTGPQGIQGPAGADGQSAYQAAVAAGYTGTESVFNEALATLDGAPFLPLAGGTMAEGSQIKWQSGSNYAAVAGVGGVFTINANAGATIATDSYITLQGGAGFSFSTSGAMMVGAAGVSYECPEIAFNGSRLQYVGTPTTSTDAANKAYVDAAKPVLRTATLTTSGWSSNTQTVTVSGVVADTNAQLIYVSPANKDSATAWGGAGVFCSAQGANSLTFVCDSVPSANISVNISIQEAQT